MNPVAPSQFPFARFLKCVAICALSAVQWLIMVRLLKGVSIVLGLMDTAPASVDRGGWFRLYSMGWRPAARWAIDHWNYTGSWFLVVGAWAMLLVYSYRTWLVYYLAASLVLWMLVSTAVALILF
jgi:hypothetical protein